MKIEFSLPSNSATERLVDRMIPRELSPAEREGASRPPRRSLPDLARAVVSWGASAFSDARKFNPFEQIRRSSYFSSFSNSTVWAIREIKRRSPELQSYVEHQKTNVAGRGPTPTFDSVKDPVDRAALRRCWRLWACGADPSQLDSWAGIMQATAGNAALDGRAFVIVRYHDSYKGGVAFQPLSRDWLVDDFSHQEMKAKEWRGGVYNYANGVYYDPESGVAAAYEFFKAKPGGLLFGNRMGERVVISAEYVLDLHYPSTGADFWSHPPEAIIAAVPYLYALSCIDTDFLGISKKLGETLGFLKAVTETIPDMDADLADLYRERPIPQTLPKDRTIDLLPLGTEWQAISSSVPNPDTAAQKKSLVRGAAAALQVSYATLSGDVSDGNYSSNRAATIEEREGYEIRQDHLVGKICMRAMPHWILNMIATGKLKLRRAASMREAKETGWRCKAWQAIDELKAARALQTRVSLGITSIPREIEAHGGSVEETIAEMADWIEKLKAAGLTIADVREMGGGGVKNASDGDRPGDEDEKDD